MRTKREMRKIGMQPGQICFCLLCAFCLLLLVRNADAAVSYMNTGLLLCARTVIPALFPFMVLSELMVSLDFGTLIGKTLGKPLARLFRISPSGVCAVVLGALCGFPLGAKTAVSLYDRGEISRAEASRLLTFSNNPSSAFLISAVGVSLFGSRRFGLALYAVTLLSSALIGIFVGFFAKKEPPRSSPLPKPETGIGVFTRAVSSSATGMLTICAYVVFFSALTGTLGHALSAFRLPNNALVLFGSFFELSSGVSTAAALPNRRHAALFAAAAAGWSGLSVHFQILSLCDGRGFSVKPYFLAKLAQGALNVFLLALWFFAFGEGEMRSDADVFLPIQTPLAGIFPTAYSHLFTAAFLLTLLAVLVNKTIQCQKRIRKRR